MPYLRAQPADIGKVVKLRARLVSLVHDPESEGGGSATVRVATGVTGAGRGAWTQLIVPLTSLIEIEANPPEDERYVPYFVPVAAR